MVRPAGLDPATCGFKGEQLPLPLDQEGQSGLENQAIGLRVLALSWDELAAVHGQNTDT